MSDCKSPSPGQASSGRRRSGLRLRHRWLLTLVNLVESTEHHESVIDVLVEVSLISHEHGQVHCILINDHARDLGRKRIAKYCHNGGVDCIADHLAALSRLIQLAESLDVERR